MQLKLTTTALVAAVAGLLGAETVVAAPRPQATPNNGHVYACTNAGWTGRCQNMYFTANQCLNFPSDLQDNISSIGPDGGWLCLAYEDINCSGYSFYVQKPGESDLSTRSDGVNDQLSSIACWWTGVGA